MKILSAQEIRNWDQFTIEQEPVSSLDLMERAASRVTDWILYHYPGRAYSIFCGKGNNGGDGLAIARQLLQSDPDTVVNIYILEFGVKGTEDFQVNLARLHHYTQASIFYIQEESHLPVIDPSVILIDALFGSGLNRGLEGLTATLVDHINVSGAKIISVDIPSGLFTDRSAKGMITVKAHHTLSFQCYKPAFFFAENEDIIGELEILDIGLHPAYLNELKPAYEFITLDSLRTIFRPRKKFAHKGIYGHALLFAGSAGKMGAAVLAARACLRSGTGLVSLIAPLAGVDIIQTSVPEAMVMNGLELKEADLSVFRSIGIGPGLGTGESAAQLVAALIPYTNVIDADALNILSLQPALWKQVRPGAILCPHPKEFERLFGSSENDFERAEKARAMAREHQVIIILKGHYSLLALPGGQCFFNITGNPGMATGGSGDVLTGILTGLIAQGYLPEQAAKLGLFLHGLAGDIAAEKLSMEALIASDITDNLGEAFLQLQMPRPRP